MNVMIPQIQTYVRLVQTRHNSDRLHVRFVIMDSTVQSQQIRMNVLLRLVFELISIFNSFADWLRAQSSIHPFEKPLKTYETGNRTVCTDCEPGHYCLSGFQFECLVGTYQNATATARCDKCPINRSCDGKALTNYMNCPPLWFSMKISLFIGQTEYNSILYTCYVSNNRDHMYANCNLF